MKNQLIAGAASVDVSPVDSQFLYGYPHVPRYSTGIHDPLLSSALYVSDGATEAILVSSDVIYISKTIAANVRRRIAEATGIAAQNIMISATHTHSGPLTSYCLITDADPVVPKPDPNYIRLVEDGIVAAASKARKAAQPARIGLAHADDTGVGTHRHFPADGPSDHQVPVMLVQSADGKKNIACMLVCSMHPTVLHEDSKLVSGDFPGLARIWLQKNVLGKDCVVLHQTGPAGNQSPRHVTQSNTFEEAQRLGEILAKAVAKAITQITFTSQAAVACSHVLTDLPRRPFASVDKAQAYLDRVAKRLDDLRKANAPRVDVRTAECDWFGGEETLTLSQAAANGRIELMYQACLPAEIQVIRIGDWKFVSWPGEIFIEYSLALKAAVPGSYLITCANGETQTYIVTKQAAEEAWYETGNAIFSYQAGEVMLEKTLDLLKKMC